MTFYSVKHNTRFNYSRPISESVMQLHMQPRSDGGQRCRSFELSLNPRAELSAFKDHLGNVAHAFDIPRRHTRLGITATALVEKYNPAPLPDQAGTWDELDAIIESENHWEFLTASHFAKPTPTLRAFAAEIGVAQRRDDPLTMLKDITRGIYTALNYIPGSTTADSAIDDALKERSGVCQDFAHIMTAIARDLRIPCRYVSGYIFTCADEEGDCSQEDATHAWVEALLPGHGWIGFDPTNNKAADIGHIRVALGRDYFDVPPTRGVFKGDADSELSVSVEVNEVPASEADALTTATPAPAPLPYEEEEDPIAITALEIELEQRQQQQQ